MVEKHASKGYRFRCSRCRWVGCWHSTPAAAARIAPKHECPAHRLAIRRGAA